MVVNKVFAYFSRRHIDLVLNIPGTPNWNPPMESPGFKIYKGSKNSIEIVVRNNDRKPINLLTSMLIMTIINPDSHQVYWQRPIMILDPMKGSAVLVLDRPDTDDWPITFYRWSVSLQHSDTTQSILYVDRNEGGYGYFELCEGPVIGPTDSLSCTNFTPGQLNQWNNAYYYSDVFPANAQINQHDFGSMTVAIYMTNWTGLIFIQGCLEDSVPVSSSPWFPIQIEGSDATSVTGFTGIIPMTFEASLAWVQVVYLADPLNFGTFDKVLFRT